MAVIHVALSCKINHVYIYMIPHIHKHTAKMFLPFVFNQNDFGIWILQKCLPMTPAASESLSPSSQNVVSQVWLSMPEGSNAMDPLDPNVKSYVSCVG